MATMDTTQTEKMLNDLAEADPAEAPDIADELAAELTEKLEASSPPPRASGSQLEDSSLPPEDSSSQWLEADVAEDSP